MERIFRILIAGFLLLTLCAPLASRAQEERTVYVLTSGDAVTAALADYIARGIGIAEDAGAEAVVVRLDTPGGDLSSMLRIMEDLENASVPVILYVWPRGGMAASAGTLILLAAHGAAMAPRTTIGAAHPVVSGGEQSVSEDQMEKMINVVVQHAELFANRRGEAAVDWAQRAIRESATAGPQEALELGVIDLVAEDLEALLDGFDGLTVTLGDGREVTLHTADALVEEVAISPIERLLSILVDPNIALLLLTIGVQAILIEISAPGGWVAGFLGAVCLALAAYALGVLTFNWLGLALIGISFVLFVIDVKAPTHGALTVAGIGTFVAGALVLFNRALTYPYGQLSVPLVIVLAVLTGLFFAFVVTKALGAQKRRPVTGKEGLIGRRGTVKVRLEPEGTVLVAGERWDAVTEEGPIAVGEEVEITGVEGFCLHVRASQDVDSESPS